MSVFQGDHVVVMVATDKLWQQPRAEVGYVIESGQCELIQLYDRQKVRVHFDVKDEGITWCWWGQYRVVNALKAAHALGAPVHQTVGPAVPGLHLDIWIKSSADAD